MKHVSCYEHYVMNKRLTYHQRINAKFFRSSRPEVFCKDGVTPASFIFILKEVRQIKKTGLDPLILLSNVSHTYYKLHLGASWFIYLRNAEPIVSC